MSFADRFRRPPARSFRASSFSRLLFAIAALLFPIGLLVEMYPASVGSSRQTGHGASSAGIVVSGILPAASQRDTSMVSEQLLEWR
jgi:hypothetical protein